MLISLTSLHTAEICSLSDRQWDVIRRVSGGWSNKSIARELGLSVRTVEAYRRSALRKIAGARQGSRIEPYPCALLAAAA